MATKDVESPVEAELDGLEPNFITSVEERYSQDTFPLALPEEQDVVSVADAERLLACVQKDDQVKIKSSVDSEYAKHRPDASLDDDTESVFRARWARTAYYPLLLKYREKKAETHAPVEALQLIMDTASHGSSALTGVSLFG